MAVSGEDTFNQALSLLRAGQLEDAERKFKRLLRREPRHVGALNILGIVMAGLQKHDEAEKYFRSALSINSSSDVTLYNYALTLKSLGRPHEALELFNRALAINSGVAETWNNRGTVFNDLGRYVDAIGDFDRSISLKPDYPEALCNKARSLTRLSSHEEALAAYDRALAVKPGMLDALIGRGHVCRTMKRYDEAFAAFDRAATLSPQHVEAWLARGVSYLELKRYSEALAAYDRALARNAALVDAWFGRGIASLELGGHREALEAFDRAVGKNPDFADGWLGRGNVFYVLGRYTDAIAEYDKAIALKDGLAEAWLGRGNALSELKRYAEAFRAYDKAFTLKPEIEGVEGMRLLTKLSICDWREHDAEADHLIASVREGRLCTSPFELLAVATNPHDQLHCAKRWSARKFPAGNTSIRPHARHDRIRIAYLSADFGNHPVSYLTAGLLGSHDASRFEVFVFSWGPDDNSEIRERIKNSVEHFVDVRNRTNEEILAALREKEIDIAVDLMGYTGNVRMAIFAARPAPVQVNFLGFAGTLGAEYIDYIVADRIVVPPEEEGNFSEKLVYLPDSYLPNDVRRKISDRRRTRAECGLPETGFTFCCFNNHFKITPVIFDLWMRLLNAIEGSVLWLSVAHGDAKDNLRREAAARGVDPERLVFASLEPAIEDHLARLRLADLFLDTTPYNAHTTASDALWVGVPVLTCVGQTFAGRVAASLLNAVHLPELATHTLQEYERVAVDLATHPEKLAQIRSKLADNRLSAPLFDTIRFTRNIEAAYAAMHERHHAGLAPEPISVSPR